MNDFIKLFAENLKGPYILRLMEATVNRICKEQAGIAAGKEKTDSTDIVIDKCCTVLRICVDNGKYMPEMKDQFEEALKPVLKLLANPSAIKFDDDIIVLIKTFVKKSKGISPVMWELFDLFPSVVAKNKGQLCDLIDTINHFMVYGKQTFAQRECSIRALAEIIEKAMFTHKIMSDCEGAVLCQLLMQSLAGT